MQQTIFKKSKKIIYLDLYVDESKERKYKDGDINETIDYIMIMAVPLNKKKELFDNINNSRCLSEDENEFSSCKKNCKYHESNNCEIHYTDINRKDVKYKIANKWIDVLLDNNLNNKKNIYFNIFGIIESNLNKEEFGLEKQYSNIYTRFFRTALINVVNMFKEYDKIVIKHIYHDNTTEMEQHKYFSTNAIKKIRLKEFILEQNKIVFETDKIEFIDSNHKKGDIVNSQFIQFVDLILGLSCNVIHNEATNDYKKELTEKIYPLISRILDKKKNRNRNSKYNYYKKQEIYFFPYINKEECMEKYKSDYEKYDIDKLLNNINFFMNYKKILFNNDNQIKFWDLLT